MDLKRYLQTEAARLGFLSARVAATAPALPMGHYDNFLAAGWAGEMDWLTTGRDARAEIDTLLPGARSVLVLAFDYTRALPPDPGGLTGRVASYAWGRDYHNYVLRRVRKLQAALRLHAPAVGSYSSVDSRPVFERAWAARAGVGFVGRNACQILPGESSRFFLATLSLTAELEPDAPLDDHCGRCRRCVDACPTGAILPNGGLVATRCISYLTIEADAPCPEALRPLLGRWVFGCDDCQDVCPHQRERDDDGELPSNVWLDLPQLLSQSDEAQMARFLGSPLRRAAGQRLRRNAAYVLGNLGDRAAIPALEAASREVGVVGDAAEWALSRIREP